MHLYYAASTPTPKDPNAFALDFQLKQQEIVTEIIERFADGTENRTHIRKTPTNLTVLSVDSFNATRCDLQGKQVQVIEGPISLRLRDSKKILNKDECLLIPSNTLYTIDAPGSFKIIIVLLPDSFKDFPDFAPSCASTF